MARSKILEENEVLAAANEGGLSAENYECLESPESKTIESGESAILTYKQTATPGNTGTATWYKDNTVFSEQSITDSETSGTYSSSITVTEAGEYYCVFTGIDGSIPSFESNKATITVKSNEEMIGGRLKSEFLRLRLLGYI